MEVFGAFRAAIDSACGPFLSIEDVPDDDGALVRQYLDGDPDAFAELVRRHAPVVQGFLRSRTRSVEAAEDLTQDVFIRALGALPRYAHRERFRAWLLAIARNLATDREREEGRKHMVSIELPVGGSDTLTLADTLPASDRHDPARVAEARDTAGRAGAALAELHPGQREVFELRQAGLSFNEIAKVQRVSINTALGRMHDAVRHLREKLGGEDA